MKILPPRTQREDAEIAERRERMASSLLLSLRSLRFLLCVLGGFSSLLIRLNSY
jgi:hypothetical protein